MAGPTRVLLALTRFTLAAWLASWALFVLHGALGGRVERWQLVGGGAIGLLAALAPLRTLVARGAAVVVCVAAAVGSAQLAIQLPDASWDANLYRYPAAFALADGWNPVRDPGCPVATPMALVADVIRCYPKATWIASAQAYVWCGTIDAGNLLHWLLMASAIGPGLLLARYRWRARRRTALTVAMLAAANPVTLAQLASGYADTVVASLCTITVFGWLAHVHARGGSRATPCLGSLLLVGTKFTGLVHEALFGAGAVLLLAASSRRRAMRAALALAATFFVGSLPCCGPAAATAASAPSRWSCWPRPRLPRSRVGGGRRHGRQREPARRHPLAAPLARGRRDAAVRARARAAAEPRPAAGAAAAPARALSRRAGCYRSTISSGGPADAALPANSNGAKWMRHPAKNAGNGATGARSIVAVADPFASSTPTNPGNSGLPAAPSRLPVNESNHRYSGSPPGSGVAGPWPSNEPSSQYGDPADAADDRSVNATGAGCARSSCRVAVAASMPTCGRIGSVSCDSKPGRCSMATVDGTNGGRQRNASSAAGLTR